MKNVFKPLADLEFSKLLAESTAQTQTGSALLNKYRAFMLTNESSCGLVNNFIKEAKQLTYDSGITDILNNVLQTIDENKVSWQLASACEAINANNSSYNYLNRNAASQVEQLLEHDENEVVKYIKAGALKNVMYCESFRSIVKNVFCDREHIVTEEYTATVPTSYTEMNEGKMYFQVLGKIYSADSESLNEAKASEVSGDFLAINRLLESANAKFDANAETLVVDTPLAEYTVYEEDGCVKCKRTSKKVGKAPKDPEGKEAKEIQETITFDSPDALREHNRLVVGATVYNMRNHVADVLEALAKAFEHFENFALLNNTKVITSNNDKFVVIENNENIIAYSLASNHTSPWKLNTTVIEALDFIKKRTSLNIGGDYKANINTQIEKIEEDDAEKLKQSIENDAMNARKNKIAELMEKFKDEPAKLAVLSKVAQELNELGE